MCRCATHDGFRCTCGASKSGSGCMVPFVVILSGIAGFGMFITHFV
jgi:hypothetical protein